MQERCFQSPQTAKPPKLAGQIADEFPFDAVRGCKSATIPSCRASNAAGSSSAMSSSLEVRPCFVAFDEDRALPTSFSLDGNKWAAVQR